MRQVVAAHAHEVGAVQERRGTRVDGPHPLAGEQVSQHALPAEHDAGARSGHVGPLVGHLGRDRGEEPRRGRPPGSRQRLRWDGIAHRQARLDAAARSLLVVEDRPPLDGHRPHLGSGGPQELDLVGLPRLRIEADDDAGPDAQAGHGQPAVGHPATEAPAARIGLRDIPRRGPDHDHVRSLPRHPVSSCGRVASRSGPDPWVRPPRASGRLAGKPILAPVALRDGDAPLFFYELHESDIGPLRRPPAGARDRV